MNGKTRRIPVALAAALLVAALGAPLVAGETSRGGAFLPLGWDARGMSLGGAATVLVRDEQAAYWNPANLVYLDGVGLGGGMVKLVAGLPSNYGTFAAGAGLGEARLSPERSYAWHRFSMAVSLSQLGLELAGGSGWDETTVGVSAAYAFTHFSAIGVTLRGLANRTDLADADASGYAVDVGVTERITRRAWFALCARNVTGSVSYPDRKESFDALWNVALAAEDLPGGLAAECDVVLKGSAISRFLAGAELPIAGRLLRVTGGLDIRLTEGERTIPSFGIGSGWRFAEVFAGFVFDPLDAFGQRTYVTARLAF